MNFINFIVIIKTYSVTKSVNTFFRKEFTIVYKLVLLFIVIHVNIFTEGSRLKAGSDLSAADDKLQKLFMFHDGIKRSCLLYVPDHLDTSKSYPLIIALHGGRGNGKRMIDLTQGGFNKLADKDSFIVAYPDGIGKNWNDGRQDMPYSYKAHRKNIDDVGFISCLIDELVNKHNVDSKRVYVTGMSNGALMTHRLAIELADKIAAVAPVCGNIPADLKSSPKDTVPVLIINGVSDPLVPYEGGYIHFLKKKLGKVESTNGSVTFWIRNNFNINSPVVNELPDIYTADSCHVRKTTFGTCGNACEVVLITIEGGGHTWPGGWQYLSEKWVGRTCRDIDACETICEFFRNHSK